jgi:hypothetical protein
MPANGCSGFSLGDLRVHALGCIAPRFSSVLLLLLSLSGQVATQAPAGRSLFDFIGPEASRMKIS